MDTFNTLMIQIMSALATGGAVVTSQYIGHEEPKNAKATAGQIMLVMVAFSCTVALVVLFGRHLILRAIFGAIDDDVMAYAETYFLMSALSYPFIGMYNAGAALFRAQGNSKISMLSSLVMNVLNIGGNAIFIYGCGMAVFGAALATLISRIIACTAVLFLLQRPASMLRVDSVQNLRPDRKLIRRILVIGIPNAIENGMFQIGKLSVSSLTSTLGTAAIAANAVANNTTTLLNKQAKRYGGLMMGLAYAGAWVMNLAAFFGGNRFMLQFFNLSPEATGLALEVMVWFNIISLFIWPSSFTLPNILRAAGDARYTMVVSITSMWLFRVALCYLLVGHFGGGLLAIWTGMFVDWAFRSLFFAIRFFSGKWMENSVI